ncbi:MAG: immunoglobulin domain-containing protein, partial [Verrucomicrobiota bacterium]
TVSFGVVASGTVPLGYQWVFGGANIIGATNATLTLNHVQLTNVGNYMVMITNIAGSTNSVTARLSVVLPPVITQQPQSQSVASYTSASFTVAATGSGPLNYQWRKGGTNLVDGSNVSGSTTTNLTLTSVSMNDGGNYDVVVSNPYATTNSAVAVLTVPQTGMMLGSASAMSGNTVVVPVLMNALGVENTFLTSVGYDPAMLVLQSVQLGQATAGTFLLENDTKTNSGLIGIAIQLNTGMGVPAGTNEQVALLTFQAMPVTSNTTVSVFFTNNPTRQQTLDNNFDLLPTVYSNGIVTLLPAEYAADVYPRISGDSQVEARDWQEVGRMVAGLDVPTNSDEFARADCAPRGAPDGILTVADWVQAGRYALNLDPLTLVTMPPVPDAGVVKNFKFTPYGGPSPARTLQIASVVAQRGQMVSVPVQLTCAASENAVGLTVSFDTNRLKLIRVTLGSAMTGGRTNINYNRPGKVGMVVAMSPGASLAAGTNQLLVLQFSTLTKASGPVALTLDSSVVQLQVVDNTANALAANYVSGTVVLPPQPVVKTVKAGENLQLTWPASTGTFHVESAGNPLGPWSDASLAITTNGANATVTVTPAGQQQFFRLVGQ